VSLPGGQGRSRSRARRAGVAFVLAAVGFPVVFAASATPAAAAAATTAHIDFGTQASHPLPGYSLDYGQAFDATRGYGWEDNATGAAASLVGNGRERDASASPDERFDTLVQMQQTTTSSGGVLTVGRWEYALPDGTYDVRVAVGDATATNSVDTVVAERGTANAVTIVNGYVPTTSSPFQVVAKQVTVSDGFLTLDPTGGTNTKIDYVDIAPASSDVTAPTATVSYSGTLSGAGSNSYLGPVTLTLGGVDDVGITAISYSLDGPVAQTYSAPLVVGVGGTHTVTVVTFDAAGNVGTSTSTFSVVAQPATSGHFDFGAQASIPPAGYTLDYGLPFDANRGYGWEDNSTGAASTLVGNGRERDSSASPDERYDTLIQMQQTSTASGGVLTVGRWEYSVVNGTYDVTVAVGDATATNSTDTIVAERGTANATTIVNGYVPTATAPFQTVTKQVTVSDGFLTLDPTGGTNTKIDFVDVAPVAADTTPPVPSISLSGTLSGTGSTTYAGPVSVTVTATDSTGVTGITYAVDGAAAQRYSAPFTVSTTGSHSVVATASDAAGNVGTTTSTFSIAAAPSGVTAHIDFGAQTSVPFGGYTLDYGQGFDATRGFGWEDNATGSPASLVGNGRERNSSLAPDKRYDTVIQIQQPSNTAGVTTVGRWEYVLPNGTYTVTVGAGDSAATNSVDTIVAERGTANAVTIVNGFVPTSGNLFTTQTKPVTVSDGRLTLDPTGGTNTKLDYVDIVPAKGDTNPPVATISLSGPQATAGSATYDGPVTVTVSATDDTGVTGITYSIDSAAPQAYSAPFAVSAAGSHTVTATASDASGNTGSATSTFSITAPAPTSGHVDFGAQTSSPASGYKLDYGQAFDATRGYGWEDNATGAAASLVGNGRQRNSSASPDSRYDTLVQMQQTSTGSGGVLTVGRWEYALANGTYNVTVAVGDATAINSKYTITAERNTANATTVINGYVPTATSPFQTVTKQVTVSDGFLTLDPTGGTNTKLDFVDIAPAGAAAPVTTISLSGPQTDAGSTTYTGPVTVTIAATAPTAVTGITYAVDGAAAQAYSAAFTVSGNGPHTVTATATDAAGDTGPASSAFSIAAPSSGVSAHIDFGTQTSAPFAGYTLDYGQSFDATRGFGWEDNASGGPASLVGNGRERNSSAAPDKRYDTVIQIQQPSNTAGVTTVGRWEYVLPNGAYSVTVGVGDSAATNSVDTIVAERGTANAVTIVNGFVPTSGTLFATQTKQVTVSDGRLTLDPTGGTNTKLDYVDIVAATQAGTPQLTVSSPDSALLGLTAPRLVFSTATDQPTPPARSFVFTNSGTGPLTVSNLAIGGTDAGSFVLASGQPTTFTVAAGSSSSVSVVFRPTAPTNCPTSSSPSLIGNSQRDATLTYTTNDPVTPSGSNTLAGLSACASTGNNEPVLDQMIHAWGYSTVVDSPGNNIRNIGPLRYLPGTDEIQSPYFTVADPSTPVTYSPIAHYSGPDTANPYHPGGWFPKGATTPTTQLFAFPPDASSTSFNQQQKLMPVPTGVTSFSPAAGTQFGVWLGDPGDTEFSDDSLDTAKTTSGAVISPLHLIHGMRIFVAYGPGHVVIPNTYLVTTDVTREPFYKNNDYQDIVAVLKNVTPATIVAPAPGAASLNRSLSSGVTVGPNCAVTGFDGVLANTAGTQCNQSGLSASSSGLALTSTSGQLANGDQQNALYNLFDATRGAFTIRARVVGGLNQITSNYQQVGAFFGPDTNNFLKVEFDNESSGSAPEAHLTMFYDQKGTAGTVSSVVVPAVSSASTLDLIIKASTQVPDATPTSNDPNIIHGYPLDQITAYYSINGATPVQIGSTAVSPADVTSWFSTVAKAGIVVSNSGSSTPITETFNQFQISTP
jgi:hypothetical protein